MTQDTRPHITPRSHDLADTMESLHRPGELKDTPSTQGAGAPRLEGTPIEALELSVRAINACHAQGVLTVADLMKVTPHQLKGWPKVGKKTVQELLLRQNALTPEGRREAVLREVNFHLGQAMFLIETHPDICLEITWAAGSLAPCVFAVETSQEAE